MKLISLLLFFLGGGVFPAYAQKGAPTENRTKPIAITWRSKLAGDFSFTQKWEYPEGIERLPDGRPGCADGGFCPPRAQAIQDERGYIPKDSLVVFYSLIDTTHRHHSIQGTTNCYEYAGTHQLKARRNAAGTLTAETETNIATHCSLQMRFLGDTCLPVIVLNSIVGPNASRTYAAAGGTIQIDSNAWDKGILKAAFSFVFEHPEHPQNPLYWKGKIYTVIEREAE